MTDDATSDDSSSQGSDAKDSGWDQFGSEYDLPLFEGEPRTWVLASTGRSGSHYLGHLLTETGALGAPLEYLNPTHVKRWKKRLEVGDFAGVLTHLHRHRTSPTGWFGIKAHWHQIERFATNPAKLELLAVERYVAIRRRDRVAQAVSLAIARQTRAWISFHEAKREPTYDAAAIRQAMVGLQKQNDTWDRFFEEHGITALVVEYEDLLADTVGTVNTVLDWFGVERQPDAKPLTQQPMRQANEVNEEWRRRFIEETGGA